QAIKSIENTARINHSDINDAQIKRIIGVIDRAALEIAELD
ncbi:hypothetical protein ACLD3T_18035, partial [Salmonella sp. 741265078_PSA]